MMDLEKPGAELLDSTHGKPKLLVVDDQAINIQVMYRCFAGDYQVFMATNGEQALNLCKSNPPDLILLDVVMPGLDGFEVCKRLKADPSTSHIPVIFVTAHTDPAQETHGLSLGAVDFIAKPVNPDVVRARVKTQLTLKFQSDLLRKLVFLDGLTGVFNQAGDDALRVVAAELKTCLRRPADLVARYGGEEFACVLPETSYEDALAIADELERHIRALAIAHKSSEVAPVITISLGLATRVGNTHSDVQDLIGLADSQLYLAKHSGRGRVCSAVLAPIA